jgi:hypothetical protein
MGSSDQAGLLANGSTSSRQATSPRLTSSGTPIPVGVSTNGSYPATAAPTKVTPEARPVAMSFGAATSTSTTASSSPTDTVVELSAIHYAMPSSRTTSVTMESYPARSHAPSSTSSSSGESSPTLAPVTSTTSGPAASAATTTISVPVVSGVSPTAVSVPSTLPPPPASSSPERIRRPIPLIPIANIVNSTTATRPYAHSIDDEYVGGVPIPSRSTSPLHSSGSAANIANLAAPAIPPVGATVMDILQQAPRPRRSTKRRSQGNDSSNNNSNSDGSSRGFDSGASPFSG